MTTSSLLRMVHWESNGDLLVARPRHRSTFEPSAKWEASVAVECTKHVAGGGNTARLSAISIFGHETANCRVPRVLLPCRPAMTPLGEFVEFSQGGFVGRRLAEFANCCLGEEPMPAMAASFVACCASTDDRRGAYFGFCRYREAFCRVGRRRFYRVAQPTEVIFKFSISITGARPSSACSSSTFVCTAAVRSWQCRWLQRGRSRQQLGMKHVQWTMGDEQCWPWLDPINSRRSID
jgi:hypothetical protein